MSPTATLPARRSHGPARGLQLLLVAEHAIDLGHVGEVCGVGLRRAAGDHDARVRPLAAELADGLARLAHRFAGHRAGVDDHRIGDAAAAALRRITSDSVGVEPAAEGDDVDAHAAPALANSAGSNVPSNSNSTGPVISTWLSLSRHSIASSPPGSVTRTLRPVRFSRAAATAAAQAAEPQALVSPAPRSQVRIDDVLAST